MTKEENYIGSQQHFEDNVNAHYDKMEREQQQCDNREQPDDRDPLRDLLDEVEKLRSENQTLKSQLPGNPEQLEWISVKDKLPKNRQDVMVWFDKPRESIVLCLWNKSFLNEGATHWMNLPEKPKQ